MTTERKIEKFYVIGCFLLMVVGIYFLENQYGDNRKSKPPYVIIENETNFITERDTTGFTWSYETPIR